MQFMRLCSLLAALSICCGAAVAADSGPSPMLAPKDPTLERARSAIAQKDWAGAQSILREAVARDPKNADYHNLYAYSTRKGPNPDMKLVFSEYQQALALDPRHKGAHEYLGEAYLQVGDLAKAKEQLAELDKLCFFSCEEYDDLKEAIADYEKKTASK